VRILVLGAGGVGSALAAIARRRSFVERLVLADLDAARARAAEKRGGGMERLDGGARGVDLDGMPAPGTDRALEVCALDEALDALARLDPRRAKVIELRFFGGLTVEETAEILQISPQSVMRDWKLARAWLMRELRASGT
jgi:RNA polymerase sigma factor (TIGR02999 family)